MIWPFTERVCQSLFLIIRLCWLPKLIARKKTTKSNWGKKQQLYEEDKHNPLQNRDNSMYEWRIMFKSNTRGNNLAQGEQSGPKEANPPLYSSQDNHVILKQVIAILLGSIFSQISSNKSTKYSLLICISDLQSVLQGLLEIPKTHSGVL